VLVLPVHTLEEISPPVDFGWFDVDVLLKVMQPALDNMATSATGPTHAAAGRYCIYCCYCSGTTA
jgi:hypothetical protein